MPRAIPLLLVGLVACVWLWARPGVYHYDDFAIPVGDASCQGLAAWSTRGPLQLRPLTKLTFAVESTLGATSADARRLTSLGLHLAATLIILLLLRDHVAWLPAFVGALLYGLHPIHAESVLALAGRSAVLSILLVLGALLAQRRGRPIWAIALAGLAILAREAALPMALIVMVLALRALPDRRHRLATSAILLASFLPWFLLVPRHRSLATYSFVARPWLKSVVAQVAAVPTGLSLYFRPWALTYDHGEALPKSPVSFGFALGLLLLALGVALAIRYRSLPMALVMAALLPTQTVVPKLDPLTERPFATALAGFVLLLAAVPWARASQRLRTLAVAVGLTAALLLGLASIGRARLYRSELLFTEDAARKTQVNPRPLVNYATTLMQQDRLDLAYPVLLRAHRLTPVDPLIQRKIDFIDLKRRQRW